MSPKDALAVAAAIPFALARALCNLALDRLIGPEDEPHPMYQSTEEIDLASNGHTTQVQEPEYEA